MPKHIKFVLTFAVAALAIWFIFDAFNQPGVQDLRGKFEEVATYRNENNTGPVIRIYAVTVAEPEAAEMEQYGNYMPHTKYGNTRVYFFKKGSPVPDKVYPGDENFPATFQQYLLAQYEKDAMGTVSFRKF